MECALIVQLDRALDFESRSRGFESRWVYLKAVIPMVVVNAAVGIFVLLQPNIILMVVGAEK